MPAIPVVLEVGQKKVFAAAVDWPGWCRSGKGEQGALSALAGYSGRYAPVAALAGLSLPPGCGDAGNFQVVESVPGNASTEFGVPGVIAAVDRAGLSGSEAARMTSLVGAAWTYLDSAAAAAPAELRKGPRGGGRDRDKMLAHELDAAQNSYARKLGLASGVASVGDTAAVAAFRATVLELLGRQSSGEPLAEKGWPPRYAARRIAWHSLDHAWEMQDRS
ncbi:MAG TPA: hypothetical protein VHA57_03515 [Actinomycetota bacterium]|nr:hypothetical protein [Actinomycetota bacterium]